MNPITIADALQPQIAKAITDLVANNVGAVAIQLLDAEDGKLSVSISLALTLSNSRIYLAGKLAYSKKFTDEIESQSDLGEQLPGIDG